LGLAAAAVLALGVACGEGGDNAVFLTRTRSPAWGPDGRICYVDEHALWVCEADGQNKRRLTPEGQFCFDPDWDPNGPKIIYTGYYNGEEKTDGIYIISAESGEPQLLVGGDYEEPAWSPDGEYVACTARFLPNNEWGLFVFDVASGERRRISTPDMPRNPDWSPSGEWIIFSRNKSITEPDPDTGLWIIKPDGTGLRRLVTTPAAVDPCWSADGAFIAYRIYNYDIYTYELRTAETKKVTTEKSAEPSWSPKGGAIVFTSGRSGEDAIYIIFP